jgi:YD repeat-containing protein
MKVTRLVCRLLWISCVVLIAPLVGSAGTENYGYDALGRLISVTSPGGAQTIYNYDAAGNRTSITVSGGGSPPTAPTGLSGYSPAHGVANLVWTASTGGTPPYTYYVEACNGASCTNFAVVKTSTTASTTVTGLFYPATYRFRVRARDQGGTGNYSGYSNIFNLAIN